MVELSLSSAVLGLRIDISEIPELRLLISGLSTEKNDDFLANAPQIGNKL